MSDLIPITPTSPINAGHASDLGPVLATQSSMMTAPAEPQQVAVKFVTLGLAGTKRVTVSQAGAKRSTWKIGDRFELELEPTNQADPNAIKVMRLGERVGYVSKKEAEEMRKRLNEGWSLSGWCFLRKTTGGVWDEGVIEVRLENVLLGWPGYNPLKSRIENQVQMEQEILTQVTASNSTLPSGLKGPRL